MQIQLQRSFSSRNLELDKRWEKGGKEGRDGFTTFLMSQAKPFTVLPYDIFV